MFGHPAALPRGLFSALLNTRFWRAAVIASSRTVARARARSPPGNETSYGSMLLLPVILLSGSVPPRVRAPTLLVCSSRSEQLVGLTLRSQGIVVVAETTPSRLFFSAVEHASRFASCVPHARHVAGLPIPCFF